MHECVFVMTRAQRKQLGVTSQVPEVTEETCISGQPRIVEIINRPNNAVKLQFINQAYLNRLRETNRISKENNIFY